MAGGAERGNDSDKLFKCFVEGHIIKGDERFGKQLCRPDHLYKSDCSALTASQRSLHNAPIFRLLLKVAVNGTHECDFLNL